MLGVPTRPLREAPPSGTSAPLWDRLCRRAGFPRDVTNLNKRLIHELEKAQADVLWVEKALALRSSTLQKALRMWPQMRAACFSGDDMFSRNNSSVGFRRSLPLYDVVFTTKSFNASDEELPRLGAQRVVFVWKAFDRRLHRPVKVGRRTAQRLGGSVGFIGTFEQERAETMLALAERDIPVRVWGNGWEPWRGAHPKLWIEGRPVYGEDYVRTLCSTQVNLGFLRCQSRDLHTDRSVEIPACGAFLLAERTSEHTELFDEGVEAEFFDGIDELEHKVRYYLEYPARRARIAAAGRARCLRSDYSHEASLAAMVAELERVGRAAS